MCFWVGGGDSFLPNATYSLLNGFRLFVLKRLVKGLLVFLFLLFGESLDWLNLIEGDFLGLNTVPYFFIILSLKKVKVEFPEGRLLLFRDGDNEDGFRVMTLDFYSFASRSAFHLFSRSSTFILLSSLFCAAVNPSSSHCSRLVFLISSVRLIPAYKDGLIPICKTLLSLRGWYWNTDALRFAYCMELSTLSALLFSSFAPNLSDPPFD